MALKGITARATGVEPNGSTIGFKIALVVAQAAAPPGDRLDRRSQHKKGHDGFLDRPG